MAQITATLPDDLVRKIDRVAARLNSSRAKLAEQAVECYLDDVEDFQLESCPTRHEPEGRG